VIDQQSLGRVRADRWRWPVLGLALVSVVFWAASYSWLAGLTPPTRWVSPTASPWLIMEIAAVTAGAPALVGGLLVARGATDGIRRTGVRAAWMGGFAVIATTASLVVPV
jgi:hypothetical protein